jgi:AraC-like DNA-binding protein
MTPYYENSEDELRVFHADDITFPAHLHSQMEFIYVQYGTIEVTIYNKTLVLKEGDFAIVFPNTIHSYVAYDTEQPCRLILAICGLNYTGDFFKQVTSYHPTSPFLTADRLHCNVGFAMRELEMEQLGAQDLHASRSLIQLILSRVLPLLTLHKNKDMDNYDLTYQIVSYVAEHFQEALTLSDLANHLGVSKYYLSRIFSLKLNTSFNKYLNYIRLNYAQTLIQSTNHTLTRISADSGFESQRTFNRAFQEIYHIAPSELRNKSVQ